MSIFRADARPVWFLRADASGTRSVPPSSSTASCRTNSAPTRAPNHQGRLLASSGQPRINPGHIQRLVRLAQFCHSELCKIRALFYRDQLVRSQLALTISRGLPMLGIDAPFSPLGKTTKPRVISSAVGTVLAAKTI